MLGTTTPTSPRALLGSLVLAAALITPAAAQDVILFKDAAPTADELAEILFPDRTASNTPNIGRTRGIIIHRDPPSQSPVADTATTAAAPATPSAEPSNYAESNTIVGFTINFAFDSAELLPDSYGYLDSMGELLSRQEFIDASMLIVGHTDAAGSDVYNQQLSERRAASVRDYLVRQYDVDPSRLRTEGRGESSLLGGYSPTAGENRRVEFQAEG